MTRLSSCGLLETPYNFFIDHLAPLCFFLDIPILTSWPQTLFLFKRYYPNVNIQIKNWSVRYLLENFTSVLYSFVPEPRFRKLIETEQAHDPDNELWKRPLKLIHHFHGCSDKGYHSDWIKPDSHLQDLDLLLIYGKRFEALLKDKNLYHLPKSILSTGNYRLLYYQKHQTYLNQIVQKEIFSIFKKKQPTLLYAPTWADHENSSSFLKIFPTLFEKLPPSLNLIVKLHPNMTLKTAKYDPALVVGIIQKYKNLPNVLILPFYPLIYPLLNFCDLYLGDHSSVGYDMLHFEKPMFFLNVTGRNKEDKGALLFQAGHLINEKDFPHLYEIISTYQKNSYKEKQKEIYEFAFGQNKKIESNISQLKTIFAQFQPHLQTSSFLNLN